MNPEDAMTERRARLFGEMSARQLWQEVAEALEIAALKRGSRRYA